MATGLDGLGETLPFIGRCFAGVPAGAQEETAWLGAASGGVENGGDMEMKGFGVGGWEGRREEGMEEKEGEGERGGRMGRDDERMGRE